MNTILAAIVLGVFGVIANFLSIWLLNIAGLPGGLLAVRRLKAGQPRPAIATAIAILGQSYVYLAYVAFVVNWTKKASIRSDMPLGFLLWAPAFLAVAVPISRLVAASRIEAVERGYLNAQDEALRITAYIAILGFVTFALVPSLINLGWGWIPYVR